MRPAVLDPYHAEWPVGGVRHPHAGAERQRPVRGGEGVRPEHLAGRGVARQAGAAQTKGPPRRRPRNGEAWCPVVRRAWRTAGAGVAAQRDAEVELACALAHLGADDVQAAELVPPLEGHDRARDERVLLPVEVDDVAQDVWDRRVLFVREPQAANLTLGRSAVNGPPFGPVKNLRRRRGRRRARCSGCA